MRSAAVASARAVRPRRCGATGNGLNVWRCAYSSPSPWAGSPQQSSAPFLPAAFPGSFRLLSLFEQRELDLLLNRIDAVDQHAHTISQAVCFAGVLADDLARGFVESVVVVVERVQRDQAFDEEVGEFDEESEFGDADDEAVEVFSD